MPKKTKIIFITVFVIVGLIVLGLYLWLNRNTVDTGTGETPWYQPFNPFGSVGTSTTNTGTEPTEPNLVTNGVETQTSRFYQITDFAVAGATFLEDTRLISSTEQTPEPEQIKTIIPADTKEGRKEIQAILNSSLSLTPPLVIDGSFGKLAIQAIKDFQKLNNIPITGIVDETTAPYFTKIVTSALPEKSPYEIVPSIRYVERLNGHIYKMFIDTKSKEKISNSTIPSIYEAFFDKTGQSVVYRYLSTDNIINTFVATLGAEKGDFLPQNVSDLSVSSDKTKFFYLTENSTGVTGTVGIFGGTQKNIVFSSPFTEWLSSWDANQKTYLTTKPSYSVPGSIFLLNPTNRTISKIFGGVNGLTTAINPNGSAVLYSISTTTGPKLSVFNIKEHASKDLDTYGLPEKCTWSSDNINVYCAVPNVVTGNQYPDYWYQGLTSFDDFFVKINTATGEKTTYANSIDETPVDGTNLFLSKAADFLFFINKKDYTLWSLSLE